METQNNLLSSINKIKTLGLNEKERFKYKNMSSSALRKSKNSKSKHRSDIILEDWSSLNYHNSEWCKEMLENPPESKLKIEYEDYENMDVDEFRNKYERLNIPVIIKGATKKWKASDKWSFEVKMRYNLFLVETI